MARRLFGTDGVRGVAGEFLTAELALALGAGGDAPDRRRAPAGADRARHARVRRDAPGGRRRGRQRRRRRRAARRGAADARRAAAARALRLRPGGRALGLAQPLPGQRHQVLRAATATSSPTRPRWRSSASSSTPARPRPAARGCRRRGAGDRAHPRAARRRRGLPARAPHALRRARSERPRRAARLRQRRHLPRRAGDLQAPRRAT